MDINFWQQLISSFGLPVVIIGVLGWFIFTIYKHQREDRVRHNEETATREERLFNELAETRKINETCTQTLIRINERLDEVEKHILRIEDKIA